MVTPIQRTPRSVLVGLLILLGLLALSGCGAAPGHAVRGAQAETRPHATTHPAASGTTFAGLRVVGDHLMIGAGGGQVVQLRGINRSGTEYKCEQAGGFFDSPTPDTPDSPAMIAAMKSWDIDVVRLPLNEGCWLGTGAPAPYEGAAYRAAIQAEVSALNNAGLFVVLSLQWLDVTGTADLEAPMPDRAHAPDFWTSVAATFKADPDVLFDLYNEPFSVDWSCWRDGCQVPAGAGAGGGGAPDWPSYTAAGMQQLVTAVRRTGAAQPVLLGGLDYALDLSGWLAHEPDDPDHALVAAVHSYGGRSPCGSSCETTLQNVAETVPVVFGELGETDCRTGYIDSLMDFADSTGIGYLGWAWDATSAGGWTCAGGPALISNYAGTPTAYGAGFRSHFASLGAALGPLTGWSAPDTTAASPGSGTGAVTSAG